MKVGDLIKLKRACFGYEPGTTGLLIDMFQEGEQPSEGWYKSSWTTCIVLIGKEDQQVRCLKENLEVISESR
jgi:hypothetical protein